MLCRVCREDLLADKFNPKAYRGARVTCSAPICKECHKLPKSARKALTSKTVRCLRLGTSPVRQHSDSGWNQLSPHEKRKKQMENRTPCEQRLGFAMEDAGISFEVQHPIGPYWADFFIIDSNLVIEVDGNIHDKPDQRAYDERRTRALEQMGKTVIRFKNEEVTKTIDAVILKIKAEHEQWKGIGRNQKRKILNLANRAA